MNWGCIAFPWRTIVKNTIGRDGATRDARVLAFDRVNAILSALAYTLSASSDEYPMRNDMEDKLLHCEDDALSEAQILTLAACSAGSSLSKSGGASTSPWVRTTGGC